MNYKEGYEELKRLVEEMNSGELSIEEMVEKYEEGMKLYKDLSNRLNVFEQRVSVLTMNKESEIEEKIYDENF